MHGLQQLMAFAQTARRGSFAAAARDLGGTPSTLAKSVARLESSLGVKLFHRTTRRVNLTVDGERLFRRCERILAEVDDLKAEAAGAHASIGGTLRVDAPISYGKRVLMPILAKLLHAHPALELDLRLQDSYAGLVRDGLDCAIRVGELNDSTLVARRVDRQDLLLVASPAYLDAHGRPQRIEDLAGHRAIVFRMPSTGRHRPWQLRSGRRTIAMHPSCSTQLSDGEGIVAAAVLGLGIGQIPDNIVGKEVARGSLVELLPAHRPPSMPISVVMPSARLQPPRVRAFLEALEPLRKQARAK